MTWFKVDDGWARHAKTRKAGRDGRSLWIVAGVECAAARTDGIVAPHLLRDYAYLADVTNGKKAADALVAAGLWHDAKTIGECRTCRSAVGELEPGAFYFHDWPEWQPTRDETAIPTERLRWRRAKALARDRLLCERIVERDRNLCRYCAVRVNWKDRRGPNGGTYDHVDPDGDNSLGNVVVACRRCNARKKNRTPDEAGMVLLDAPAPYSAGSSSELDRNQIGASSDSDPTRRDPAPIGADRTGQIGSSSDLAPAGSDRDRPGAGLGLTSATNGHSTGNGHRPEGAP